MPGYILHLTEAKMVLDELETAGITLTESWKNQFMLGSLLPDTKRKTEKVTSHFWNPKSIDRWAIPPDLDLFLQKYESCLTSPDPVMWGYWTHLVLDERFVNGLWNEILEFRDEQDRPEALKRGVCKVWIKKNQISVPIQEFFSSEYYYGDYTRMNSVFLNKYHLRLPEYEEQLTCCVEEVEVQDLREILNELTQLCESTTQKHESLSVFEISALEMLLRKEAKRAARQLRQLL